MGADKSLTRSD